MSQSLFNIFLLVAFISTNVLAFRRPEAKREHSPFLDDLLTSESQNQDQGFFEDINFKSFFEDVGLKSSPSAPEGVKQRRPAPQQQQQRYAFRPAAKSNDYGFLPEDPLFEASESRNHFTIINSNDDFFAQESNPFNNFYGFDENPFAASQNHRDYVDPYSESRRVNYEDFGPPKGFFDHDFAPDFSGGDSKDKKKKSQQDAVQETRTAPKYDGEESQATKDKTKKCETVHKDTMTCEICKDDYGGFSEHCSHSLHSGKDQKYANSRRRSHEDAFNPLEQGGQGHGGQGHGGRQAPANDKASSINTRAYQSPAPHGGFTQSGSGGGKKNNDFGKQHFYDPFAEQSKISPYNFDYMKQLDELIDIGLKDIISHRKKLVDNLPDKKDKNVADSKDKKDAVRQASNKEVHEDQNQPQYNQATNTKRQQHTPAHNFQGRAQPAPYSPLDPVENFQVLGKMVKQFAKKDRANCKKRVTKKGMTCYVCPNKHGQVDEECMYESADPKQGVHMMYQEETTY